MAKRLFFSYDYDTHNTDHAVLRDIYNHSLWFAEHAKLIAVDATKLNITEIKHRLLELRNLFALIDYRNVKGLLPEFPYTSISKLAEIALSPSEYQQVVAQIALTVPLAHELLQKHQVQHVAIKVNDENVGEKYIYNNAKTYEDNKIYGLQVKIKHLLAEANPIEEALPARQEEANTSASLVVDTSPQDEREHDHDESPFFHSMSFDDDDFKPTIVIEPKKVEDVIKLQAELAQLMKKHEEKYNYNHSETSSPMYALTPSPISPVQLEFPQINAILHVHNDPTLLKQMRHMIEFMSKAIVGETIEPANVFMLYKVLVYINEAIHSNHLYNARYYDDAKILEVSTALNHLRNKIVHGIDNQKSGYCLDNMVRNTPENLHEVVAALKYYMQLLGETSVNNNANYPAYQMYQKTGMCPQLIQALNNTQYNESLEENGIYQLSTIKDILIYFKKYCAQNKLDVESIEQLFFHTVRKEIAYSELEGENLKHRLVIEGCLQVLGELAGSLRQIDNKCLFNALLLDADDHKDVEDFLTNAALYRHSSTHQLHHFDIGALLAIIFEPLAAEDKTLEQKLDELSEIVINKSKKTPDTKDKCFVM